MKTAILFCGLANFCLLQLKRRFEMTEIPMQVTIFANVFETAEQQHLGKFNIVKFPKIFPASWKTKGEDLPPPSFNKQRPTRRKAQTTLLRWLWFSLVLVTIMSHMLEKREKLSSFYIAPLSIDFKSPRSGLLFPFCDNSSSSFILTTSYT